MAMLMEVCKILCICSIPVSLQAQHRWLHLIGIRLILVRTAQQYINLSKTRHLSINIHENEAKRNT